MSKPSIAIVIPILNEERVLPLLIAKLVEIGADEVVFVDGDSSDSSPKILQEARVHWCVCRQGRARQMNLGATRVDSDIIVFLHADTLMDSGHLEVIRDAFRSREVVAGFFHVRLSGRKPIFRLIEFMINWRSRMSNISTGDQAMFVRRKLFDRLGGFPDQPLMEDIELSKRLKREGKILCLPDRVITSSRRWEEAGILRTILLMWQLRFRYWLGADPVKLKALYTNYS